MTGSGIEHHDADRRGLDQRLEVGPRALLAAVGARVGDGGGRLRGEQQQHLLVLGGELRPRLLLAEEEVADLHAAMADRRALEGLDDHAVGGESERADIGGHVGHPQRRRKIPQRLEDLHVVRPLHDLPFFLGRQAGDNRVFEPTSAVDGGDDGVTGAGQRAGGFSNLAEDGIDVEARADAQDGGGQRGHPFAQGLDLALRFGDLAQWFLLPDPAREPDRPGLRPRRASLPGARAQTSPPRPGPAIRAKCNQAIAIFTV